MFPVISAASFSRPDLPVDSDWTEHAPFIFWLCETLRPRLFVELGTHRGHSFFVFCQAMQRLSPEGRCRALDLWTGDDLTGASGDTVFRAVERYSLEQFAANAVLMRGRIDEGLMTFPDGSIDLLHINGSVISPALLPQFDSWAPKLSPNAAVLLHDVATPSSPLRPLFDRLATGFPAFLFPHGRGLGLAAAGTAVAPGLQPLFSADSNTAVQIRQAYAVLGVAVRDHVRCPVLEKQVDERSRIIAEKETAVAEALFDMRVAKEKASLALADAARAKSALDAILASNAWKITWPIRRFGASLSPPVRLLLLRTAKLAWWTLTLQLPRRLRALIRRRQEHARPATAQSDLPPARSGPPFAPINIATVETPLVSVVIPAYGKFPYTYDCIQSIAASPPHRPFEVIIVDDCSDAETLGHYGVFSGAVRVIRNDVNSGFIASCNHGAAAARGRYLHFLNNDTLVMEGWLDTLVDSFETVDNVGIVGSKLLCADGRLQEVGGILWRDASGYNWGRGEDPDDPRFCFLRDADWVSGASLMIPKDLFDALGGFDSLYSPAYYEDTDLAFRVRAAGRRVVVQPASKIVHLEGISSGRDVKGTGAKRYQAINAKTFYDRWCRVLEAHRLPGEQIAEEAERLVKRRALFIDFKAPTPDRDAGSNAALSHIIALQQLGYKVVFVPSNLLKLEPYTANLQKIGVECLHAPYIGSVEEVFRRKGPAFDLVYLHRFDTADQFTEAARRACPDCRIVYSVADLHFLRMYRQMDILADPSSHAAAAMQERRELAAMLQVDHVIVHSPYEATLLGRALPTVPVSVVPWAVRADPVADAFAVRSGFAFVGGFRHGPNVDAAQVLARSIMPLLRERNVHITAFIVGSHLPTDVAALSTEDFRIVGFIPRLIDVLGRVRLTVAPLRYGAGIKGKVLDSFALGLPCVMSEVAAEGLELPKPLDWLVAGSDADFAEKIIRLHEDEALNGDMAAAGLAYIGARYSAAAVMSALAGAVEKQTADAGGHGSLILGTAVPDSVGKQCFWSTALSRGHRKQQCAARRTATTS